MPEKNTQKKNQDYLLKNNISLNKESELDVKTFSLNINTEDKKKEEEPNVDNVLSEDNNTASNSIKRKKILNFQLMIN